MQAERRPQYGLWGLAGPGRCVVLLHPLHKLAPAQRPALDAFVENQAFYTVAAAAVNDVILKPASSPSAATS